MPDHASCAWTGASGRKYIFEVCFFPGPGKPELGVSEAGTFICARMDSQRAWVPIFVGQGDLTEVGVFDPKKIECILEKGATHVHVRVNASKQARIAEVSDLLANYPQAYAPEGCNEQGAP